jgi:hypothetical protein
MMEANTPAEESQRVINQWFLSLRAVKPGNDDSVLNCVVSAMVMSRSGHRSHEIGHICKQQAGMWYA